MTKVTLYTYDDFLREQQEAEAAAEGKQVEAVEELSEPPTLASEAQLRLFQKAIAFLSNECKVTKAAVMRALEIRNQEFNAHFATDKEVPLSELEAVAELCGIELGELQTVPDWYKRRTKYRKKMIRHMVKAGLISPRHAPKDLKK